MNNYIRNFIVINLITQIYGVGKIFLKIILLYLFIKNLDKSLLILRLTSFTKLYIRIYKVIHLTYSVNIYGKQKVFI